MKSFVPMVLPLFIVYESFAMLISFAILGCTFDAVAFVEGHVFVYSMAVLLNGIPYTIHKIKEANSRVKA